MTWTLLQVIQYPQTLRSAMWVRSDAIPPFPQHEKSWPDKSNWPEWAMSELRKRVRGTDESGLYMTISAMPYTRYLVILRCGGISTLDRVWVPDLHPSTPFYHPTHYRMIRFDNTAVRDRAFDRAIRNPLSFMVSLEL